MRARNTKLTLPEGNSISSVYVLTRICFVVNIAQRIRVAYEAAKNYKIEPIQILDLFNWVVEV